MTSAPTYFNINNMPMPVTGTATNWVGSPTATTLTGTSGNDAIYSNGLVDTLIGNGGDDTFWVYNAGDTVIEPTKTGVDTVIASVSFILPQNITNLTLTGANTVGEGNGENNLIIAQAANITLNAEGGDAVLVGSTAGSDIFVANAVNGGTDAIYNFTSSDVVRLGGYSQFTTFAAVQSAMTQQGSDVRLTLSPTSSILFKNETIANFNASNFQLPINLSGMHLTFDDEFTSFSQYNPATGTGTWRTEYGWGGAGTLGSHTLNNEQEIYVDPTFAGTSSAPLGLNPFSITSQGLNITAFAINNATDSADLWGYKYASGLITTKFSFSQEYGYFVMDAKLPAGQGVWPAFWLLPEDGTVPSELDIMESVGTPSTVYESVHSGATGKDVSTGTNTHVDTSSGFNTYGLLWGPNELQFYVDGVEVFEEATPADMHKPFYILANLAVGGGWAGSVPADFTSATMTIAYIRAYAFGAATTTTTNTPPTTKTASYTVEAGHALTETAANGVLAGDTDNNGLTMTAALAANGGPAHGTLTLNANGSFTYTPKLGYSGTDSFTYIASDSLGSSTPTTVTLNVNDPPPTTKAETYAVTVGKGLTETAANGVLAGDTDNNGLTMTAALAANGGPAHGTLTLNANGSFTYTPNAGYAGTDSFTYIASDSLGSSTPTTVTLNVNEVAPTTKADTYTIAAGKVLTETVANGVLANDTDNNGLTLTAALAANGGPAHGTLTLNADGSFTYTPNAGYAGADSFTYIASDSLGSSTPTTVALTVGGPTPNGPVLNATSTSQNFYVTSANTIINALPNSHDTVQSTVSWTLQPGINGLTLLGTGALTATGNNAGDRIIGNSGNDTIIGGAGNDYIDPGTGNTRMTGGGGADAFYFEKGAGKDIITDFSINSGDTINATALHGVSHTIVQSGANAVIEFGSGASITLLGVSATAPGLLSHISF